MQKRKNFSRNIRAWRLLHNCEVRDKEEQFEVRAKPYPPTLVTTALQLKGKAGQNLIL